MDKHTQRLDLVVVGATGFTGRLVVARLAELERRAHQAGRLFPAWGIAGRDAGRLADVAQTLIGSNPEILADIDIQDRPALTGLTERTRVLLNTAGPYTGTAEGVIQACIATGTHYLDLSGELPLLRRVIDRFDDAAREAGCQVVQLAGWEALAPDVTALQACRIAADADDAGPGAAGPIRRVDILTSFAHQPKARGGAVSAGTLGSIVEIFSDPDAHIMGDPAGLLARGSAADKVRRASPLRVRPWVRDGRLIGAQIPVAFLNPPLLHRTAALLAEPHGRPHQPARIREGIDHGSIHSTKGFLAAVTQGLSSLGQRCAAVAVRLPLRLRLVLAAGLRRVLPPTGSGPSDEALDGWRWTVTAHAQATDGRTGAAALSGTGHPGYTSTAAMLVALGLHLAGTDRSDRSGVITPAVSFGALVSPHLDTPELRLTLL